MNQLHRFPWKKYPSCEVPYHVWCVDAGGRQGAAKVKVAVPYPVRFSPLQLQNLTHCKAVHDQMVCPYSCPRVRLLMLQECMTLMREDHNGCTTWQTARTAASNSIALQKSFRADVQGGVDRANVKAIMPFKNVELKVRG